MNVQNALAAIAVARLLEVPFARVAEALRGFRSVRRRFDVLADAERMIVVDDYAHHPTAVAATIAAARGYHRGPLFVAFQPHRYSRTAFLAAQFAQALRGADRVYLAPVYAASEPAIPGVSERSIGKPLEAAGAHVSLRVARRGTRRRTPRRSSGRYDGIDVRRGHDHERGAPVGAARRIRGAGGDMSLTTERAMVSLLDDADRAALAAIAGERAPNSTSRSRRTRPGRSVGRPTP